MSTSVFTPSGQVMDFIEGMADKRKKPVYVFASDIHGSARDCKKLLECFEKERGKKLVLLGDLLYHGPRNDLPESYAPKEVICMLNQYKNKIYAVRGNCEAEVDQMVLEFPVMADYGVFELEGHTIYATHGHKYHKEQLPPMTRGDILIYGHTHLYKIERAGNFYILNPGSVSLPKGGNPKTYGVWREETFSIKDLEGNVLQQMSWKRGEDERILL